jgi:hypothetical protein
MAISFLALPDSLILNIFRVGSLSKKDYAHLLTTSRLCQRILTSSAFIQTIVNTQSKEIALKWQSQKISTLKELFDSVDSIEKTVTVYEGGTHFLETSAHLGYLNPQRMKNMIGFMNLSKLKQVSHEHQNHPFAGPLK